MLFSVTVPPCNSIMARTSGSPSPVPSCCRLSEESTCSNGLSTRSRSSAGIPIPVSAMIRTSPFLRSNRAESSMVPPGGVNFTELETRLSSTCLILRSSARNGGRSGGRHASARQLADRANDIAQVEEIFVEIELARFGLRQVEDIGDDLQQMLA